MTDWNEEPSSFELTEDQEALAALSDDQLRLGVANDQLHQPLDWPATPGRGSTLAAGPVEPDTVA